MQELSKTTRERLPPITAFIALVALGWLSFTSAADTNKNQSNQAKVARGKYLVEEVAKCTECHTPRDAQGNLNPQAWLQGAPIWIRPVRPIQNWADNVPALAGLPSFTDDQMFRVL